MAGKRHSKADMKHIQGVHDSSMSLGADCSMGNVAWPMGAYESSLQFSEASLPMNQSHDALRGHLRTALMAAHGVQDTYSSSGPYIMDTFANDVVYQHGNKTYQRSYKANYAKTPPSINLGDPQEVNRAYVPVGESQVPQAFLANPTKETEDLGVIITPELAIAESGSMHLDTDLTLLIESDRALVEAASPLIPVKLIGPGWGSSGYYSAEMLKRDGPKVFKAGLHMYADHMTKAEETARPENRVKNLASVLAEDAKWNDTGWAGAGLYSYAKPFSDHAPMLREKGKYIGTSIRGYATKKTQGEAEGRKGTIIEGLAGAASVDYVTKPGAGGALLVESERTPEPQNEGQENTMTTEEQATLREAQSQRDAAIQARTTLEAENVQLKAAQNSGIATAMFIEAFREKGIEVAVESIVALSANPPLKEGKVDGEAIKKIVEGFKSAKAGGKVRNLGESAAPAPTDDEAAATKTKEALKARFISMGLSESAAVIAAAGRV